MKHVTLSQFLTEEEIRQAMVLYNYCEAGTFAKRCCDEIIKPVMARINLALGQENDPMYLAYAVEYAMTNYHAKQ